MFLLMVAFIRHGNDGAVDALVVVAHLSVKKQLAD